MASLQELQLDFSRMIRTRGDAPEFSDIDARRLKVYKDLFYNNIESLLRQNFPVMVRILGDEHWHELIDKFWQRHRCQTPYFSKIGEEFIRWLLHQNTKIQAEYPFLSELAHYELMEVVISTADIQIPAELTAGSEQLRKETTLVINPVSELLHYHYPVFRVSPEYLPRTAAADPCHILIYRKRDHQVKFIQLSPASVILIEMLKTQARSLSDLVAATEHSMNVESGSLASHIEEQVKEFIEKEVILI
jgi:hypothetical protein